MGKRRASDADAAPEVAAAKRRRGAAASASAASSASGAAQPAASNASGASQPAWMSAILKEVKELFVHSGDDDPYDVAVWTPKAGYEDAVDAWHGFIEVCGAAGIR